ncbi:MAG: YdcF family protein [Kangiellaceae bacterium]|jgi:uncharacterized SAM-binding protein YcdF (DUF218 family)|nr:YdcF family protein [Kangiellaceae bacterium]
MDIMIFTKYLAKSLLLPPGINLLLALIAWLLWKVKRRLGRSLLLLSATSLFAFSIPSVAYNLMESLQSTPALSTSQIKQLINPAEPITIVVLGAGRRAKAPEYSDIDTINFRTLERLRYAAQLHRQTGFPILVSGGTRHGSGPAEAILMNQSLTEDFNVEVHWLEARGQTTNENARLSAEILHMQNIRKIILVTHAWHIERAKSAFLKHNINVVSAPTGFILAAKNDQLDFLPSSYALHISYLALYEWFARFNNISVLF